MPIASLVSSKTDANVTRELKVTHMKFAELNVKFVRLNPVENMPLARKVSPVLNASVITASAVIRMLHVTMLMNAMLKLVEKMLFASTHLVPLIANVSQDMKEIPLSCVQSRKPKFVTILVIADVVMQFYVLLITFAVKDCARTYVTM